MILGIILEKSMDKAPRSGDWPVGLWAFCTAGASSRGTRIRLGRFGLVGLGGGSVSL
jgi:hypothetical protein